MPNSSGLLVQADEGVEFPIVDLIKEDLPPPTLKSQISCEFGWSQAPRRQQDLDATRKEVRDIKAALSKDFDDKLADIRNELLEFRVETLGQLASLSTNLAELIAFLTKGSYDKKGKGSSSRPQPPQRGKWWKWK
ncbi:hypothetical protein F511_20808 [Dorcoceras hygrometricum]|uniref:Uncharacterized protein n=1 Tax=Dorcoceras hygrometricum TaxID=472368 RepID=A0A2Z7B8B2_9LAMI|nr:hypothetical protein F511_20808 [Dorcoceras hygrometricum]